MISVHNVPYVLKRIRHDFTKRGGLFTGQVSASVVVPVYDTDAAAVSLYRIDGCGAAERINIPKNSATADAELCHEIGDRFLPPV